MQENKDSTLVPVNETPSSTNEKIITTAESNIQDLKKYIPLFIEAVQARPSKIDEISARVAEFPLWAKIALGLVLFVPGFIVGLLYSPIVAVLEIIVGLSYSAALLILADHQASCVEQKEELKQSMNKYVDELDQELKDLRTLGIELANVLEGFKTENSRLKADVLALTGSMETLSINVVSAQESDTGLKLTTDGLKTSNEVLVASIKEQTTKAALNSILLQQVQAAFAIEQANITKATSELEQVEAENKPTLERLESEVEDLKAGIEKAKRSAGLDEAASKLLENQLADSLKNMGQYLAEARARLSETQVEIHKKQLELQRCKDRLAENRMKKSVSINELLQQSPQKGMPAEAPSTPTKQRPVAADPSTPVTMRSKTSPHFYKQPEQGLVSLDKPLIPQLVS